MEKFYNIKKASESKMSDSKIWDIAEIAEVCCFPWDENGYKPKTEARMLYTEKGFHVCLISYENKITALCTKMNDPVYRESCMEFFFKPNPEYDDRYLNFEFNALGTLNLGLGKDRYDRIQIPASTLECFRIIASVGKEDAKNFSGPCWSIRFFIPYEFIDKYFGKLNIKSQVKMTGNFYKCGKLVEYPHFGCWSEVKSSEPDFHRPECFGGLVLE